MWHVTKSYVWLIQPTIGQYNPVSFQQPMGRQTLLGAALLEIHTDWSIHVDLRGSHKSQIKYENGWVNES